jgi:hypothetical protein
MVSGSRHGKIIHLSMVLRASQLPYNVACASHYWVNPVRVANDPPLSGERTPLRLYASTSPRPYASTPLPLVLHKNAVIVIDERLSSTNNMKCGYELVLN